MLNHDPDLPPNGDGQRLPPPEAGALRPGPNGQGGASIQEPHPQLDNAHHEPPFPRPSIRQRPRLTLQFDAHHGPRQMRTTVNHYPHGLYQQAERDLQQRNGYAVQSPQRQAPIYPQTLTGERMITPPRRYHIPFPGSTPESHAALQRRLAAGLIPMTQNSTPVRGPPLQAQGSAVNQMPNNHNSPINGRSLQQSRFGHLRHPQAPNGQQTHLRQNGTLNGVPNSHTSTSNDRFHEQNASEQRTRVPQSDGSSDSAPSPQSSDPSKTMGQSTIQINVLQMLHDNPEYQSSYHRSTPVQSGTYLHKSAAEQNLGSVVGQTSAQLDKASNQVLLPAVGSVPGTPQSNLLEDGDQENTPPKRKATALEKSKSAKKARTIKTEGKSEDQLLRETRDVSYALAHPPENAYQSTRITRSWLNHAFPDHFRDNKRMIKTRSEMLAFGPARLNVTATYWKALNEENREVRPPIPMHIKDRQVIRCDEGHSLEAHSPAGSKSIACVDCGVQSFGNKHNFTTQHMMCAACIGKHEDELSGESRLEPLLKGSAWATLCDECMENCNQLPSCGCEWEKPRCIQHRRVHLKKLSRRKHAVGIPLQLCGHCNERPVSKGISYAWHCQICSGVFVLPNDIPSTWFPHLDPYKETSIANSAQKAHQDAMQGLGTISGALPLAEPGSDADFDFSYTGSSGTISEPQQATIPGGDTSGAVQTKP